MVAGLAAAAAGAYYLYYSKNAHKNRAKAKEWMEKAEDEVMEKVKKLKDALTEKNFKEIVSTVSEKYKKLRKLEEKEVASFIDALQSSWKDIKKNIGGATKKASKIIKE